MFRRLIDWLFHRPTPPPSPPGPPQPPAGDLLDLVNAARTRAGLASLASSTQLDAAAREGAALLAAGRPPHEDFAGRIQRSGFPGRECREVEAEGQPTARAAVEGWFLDPPHRAILLGAAYTHLGSASAQDRDGRPVWVADLGKYD
jgi:uncharacterized protein YkwD